LSPGDGRGLYQQFAGRVYYLARRLLRAHDGIKDVRAETFFLGPPGWEVVGAGGFEPPTPAV
jgi:hypothetical protein